MRLVDRMVAVEPVLPFQRQLIDDIVAKHYEEVQTQIRVIRRPMHAPGHSRTPCILATIMLLIDLYRQRTTNERVEHMVFSTGRRQSALLLRGVHRCMRVLDVDFDASLRRSNDEVLETEQWTLNAYPATVMAIRGFG